MNQTLNSPEGSLVRPEKGHLELTPEQRTDLIHLLDTRLKYHDIDKSLATNLNGVYRQLTGEDHFNYQEKFGNKE